MGIGLVLSSKREAKSCLVVPFFPREICVVQVHVLSPSESLVFGGESEGGC